MLWIFFTLSIIISATPAEIKESRIRSVKKKLDFDIASQLSGVALQNTSIWHVSCSDNEGPNIQCTVQLRIQTFSLTSYSATCTVSISRVHPDTITIVKKFIPFNDKQMILGLGEYHLSFKWVRALKFVNVNMKNCSTATGIIILDYADNSNDYCENVVVMTRKNEFEVSYPNMTYCQYRCEEIFDSRGHRLAGPFSLNINTMPPADYIEQWPTSYSNFKCFNVKPQERMNSSLVFKERAIQLRADIKTPRFAAVSTANGYITICHPLVPDTSSVYCTRNDFKFWIELNFHRQPLYSFVIRNLPGGEFLILTVEKSITVYLNKFNEGGQILGSVKVTKLSCYETHDLLVDMFEKSEKGQQYYCVSLVYGMDRLNFIADCYPKDLLGVTSKKS